MQKKGEIYILECNENQCRKWTLRFVGDKAAACKYATEMTLIELGDGERNKSLTAQCDDCVQEIYNAYFWGRGKYHQGDKVFVFG